MEKIKKFLMIDCFAYTAISLINAVCAAVDTVDHKVPITFNLTMFGFCSLIALLIIVTDRICKENGTIKLIFHLLDVLVPVLLYGAYASHSKFSIVEAAVNILVCVIVYGIVYLMMLLSWKEKDQRANESIQKMREKQKGKG